MKTGKIPHDHSGRAIQSADANFTVDNCTWTRISGALKYGEGMRESEKEREIEKNWFTIAPIGPFIQLFRYVLLFCLNPPTKQNKIKTQRNTLWLPVRLATVRREPVASIVPQLSFVVAEAEQDRTWSSHYASYGLSARPRAVRDCQLLGNSDEAYACYFYPPIFPPLPLNVLGSIEYLPHTWSQVQPLKLQPHSFLRPSVRVCVCAVSHLRDKSFTQPQKKTGK